MGYQDREYFRDQPHPYFVIVKAARGCLAIIAVHVLAYIAIVIAHNSAYPLEDALGLDPAKMINGWQWYRLVTASLVVDHFWHLVFSLVIIWLIGHELEALYGTLEFTGFYLLTNLLGNLAQCAGYYFWHPHVEPAALGPCSAALAMLLVGVLHYPYRMVGYLLLPMQLWIFGTLALVLEVFFFMRSAPLGIKVATHGLTLVWALAYHQFAWRLLGAWSWPPPRHREPRRRQLAPLVQSRPKRTQVIMTEASSPAPEKIRLSPMDEQLEAKMDSVLEKVATQGMGSLTEEEKSILQRASEVMRRKWN